MDFLHSIRALDLARLEDDSISRRINYALFVRAFTRAGKKKVVRKF